MIFGQVRKQENVGIRRIETGSVTDVYIGGYRMGDSGAIQRYRVTESRLANP
jgi:hypothetical protein